MNDPSNPFTALLLFMMSMMAVLIVGFSMTVFWAEIQMVIQSMAYANDHIGKHAALYLVGWGIFWIFFGVVHFKNQHVWKPGAVMYTLGMGWIAFCFFQANEAASFFEHSPFYHAYLLIALSMAAFPGWILMFRFFEKFCETSIYMFFPLLMLLFMVAFIFDLDAYYYGLSFAIVIGSGMYFAFKTTKALAQKYPRMYSVNTAWVNAVSMF